jgi:glycosyltransferase involved in cell wall biosynthesis
MSGSGRQTLMETIDLPLVSIVTPSFNQGRFLEATIQSVLAQDYPRVEYLVIDGGSTDDSVAVIRQYVDRLAYWHSQPDRGQAHAVNQGLGRATGDILGWLNSDDLLAPGTVQKAVRVFQSQPEIDVVYGRLARIDDAGRPVPTPVLPKDRVEFGLNFVIGECIVNQPGAFWRRRIMERVGLLDERLNYSLDYEYWIRMALAGATFKRLDPVVASFRLSQGSKTVGQTAAHAVEQLRTLDEILELPDLAQRLSLTAGQLERQARRARSRIALRAAFGYAKLGDWRMTGRWLAAVARSDPLAPFERHYLDLFLASLRRRLVR